MRADPPLARLALRMEALEPGILRTAIKVWDIAAAVPFCQGAGAEVRYFGPPLFPLRVFDLKMARTPFVAGTPQVCDELFALIG